MSTPYTAREQFVVDPGNRQRCIELRVPSRGIIRNVVVSQEAGVQDGFAFELFTNESVCPPDNSPDSSSSSSSSAGSTQAEELFSVFGRKSTASKTFAEFGQSYIYDCEGGSTNKKRRLFMRFDPHPTTAAAADAGPKEFHMKLDIEQARTQ